MGIPKFFRWISERYPLCSNMVQENRIPEFDNLYLDMNGIIHPCSHPNDDNPHFRITEDQIFLAIFNYIEALFSKIKPQKVFFMAVDGVAPRAKMNQQRARRFRSAKDAEDNRRKAIAKGEELPKEAAFDSNCITPGTPFMARLSEQLKYFISKKVSEDSSWAKIKVILSGHDVPGEGEHKIMDYIRKSKSMPDYAANTRHCLYGLDADLIMLGLVSHEPHFCLLREEVTFGRKKKTTATSNPDAQTFYLMHLSIFREYLDLEFTSLKDALPFEYDLERIIDDFVLLSFFVGNDFLPHLPGLHIGEGALGTFFDIYKTVLPTLSGYVSTHGQMDLERVEALLRAIGKTEMDNFLAERADIRYIDGKREELHPPNHHKRKKKGGKGKDRNVELHGEEDEDQAPPESPKKSGLVLSVQNKAHFDRIRDFITARRGRTSLYFSPDIPAREREFVISISKELGLNHTVAVDGTDPVDNVSMRLMIWCEEDDDESDEESEEARMRILKRYDKAEVQLEEEIMKRQEEEAQIKVENEFEEMKRYYYKEKLEIDYDSHELEDIVHHYVDGLQWVLLYYYQGVPSWGWFFPYHYAPKITDLVDLQRCGPIEFEKGQPFKPFYQLMGVLPAASKDLIPEAFRDLMTDTGSPILDFYPKDFECDLNEKKQDWEAVVKIPFIDEQRLIKTLQVREKLLTKEEQRRNTLGTAFIFFNDPQNPRHIASLRPGVFPDIPVCTTRCDVWEAPTPPQLVYGLAPGTLTGTAMLPGFPSLHTLPITATLGFHGVTVFQMESQAQSMVVTIMNQFDGRKTEEVAAELLGKRIYVGWPYLIEAVVVSLYDEMMKYTAAPGQRLDGLRGVVTEPQDTKGQDRFYESSDRIEGVYSKRWGTIIGPVETVVGVKLIKGLQLSEDGALIKDYGGEKFVEVDYAVQAIVVDGVVEDPRHIEKPPPPLEEEFPIGSNVFFLGPLNYGSLGEVTGYNNKNLNIKLVKPNDKDLSAKFAITREIALLSEKGDRYMPSYQVAKTVGMSSLAVSKLTSSMFMTSKKGEQRVNVGLSLKFDGKSKKVLGYSRKTPNGWEYSVKAVDLLKEYKQKFPELVSRLERKIKTDMYDESDFFAPEVLAQRVNDLKDWLKHIGVKDFDRVSLDSRALTKDAVSQIEGAVDAILADNANVPKPKIIKGVPRQAVLKPAHSKHRLTTQKFELGERVVYIPDAGNVPLAAQGTVVAIDGKTVDVVFDQTFMGGCNLEGRCSDLRGMSLYKDTLLNLSFIQPLAGMSTTYGNVRGNQNTPERIPGRPLLSPAERQYHVSPQSIPTAPAPTRNAWSNGDPPSGSSRRNNSNNWQSLPSQPRQNSSQQSQHSQPSQQSQTSGPASKPHTAGPKKSQSHTQLKSHENGHSSASAAPPPPKQLLQKAKSEVPSSASGGTARQAASSSCGGGVTMIPASDASSATTKYGSTSTGSGVGNGVDKMTSDLKNLLSIGGSGGSSSSSGGSGAAAAPPLAPSGHVHSGQQPVYTNYSVQGYSGHHQPVYTNYSVQGYYPSNNPPPQFQPHHPQTSPAQQAELNNISQQIMMNLGGASGGSSVGGAGGYGGGYAGGYGGGYRGGYGSDYTSQYQARGRGNNRGGRFNDGQTAWSRREGRGGGRGGYHHDNQSNSGQHQRNEGDEK